jgi:glycerol-3-phosphate dehydrogenase
MNGSGNGTAGVGDGAVDLVIIGGGINGAGIARDAAGRGYSVALFEQADLASGTSSWSTKLIHGGLRYLEHYEFRLVREALIEREVLLQLAPHIIRPLRFVLPHHKGLRPAWLLRLGLFLYDNLGGRKILPGTTTLDLGSDAIGKPLRPGFSKAFEYSDCWVEDARLVVLNAIDAARRGAIIRTRTAVTSARRESGGWHVGYRNAQGEGTIRAKAVINAAGPWVERVLTGVIGANSPARVRMVKGSHIVVHRLFDHDRAYIFQTTDGRIIFAIPYEDDFTLIGTTDQDYDGDPGKVAISPEETDYLCSAASEYFASSVTKDMIVWTYSGVRPLYDDGASKAQEATRDYVLKRDGGEGEAPLLNIFGGKITTYRRLAEAALAEILPLLPPRTGGLPVGWTGHEPLPGGGFPHDGRPDLETRLRAEATYLDQRLARRLVRTYGRDVFAMLSGRGSLGRIFGADLSEAEMDHLIDHEWVTTTEDVLWRRTKLGLRFAEGEVKALQAYIDGRLAAKQAHR